MISTVMICAFLTMARPDVGPGGEYEEWVTPADPVPAPLAPHAYPWWWIWQYKLHPLWLERWMNPMIHSRRTRGGVRMTWRWEEHPVTKCTRCGDEHARGTNLCSKCERGSKGDPNPTLCVEADQIRG